MNEYPSQRYHYRPMGTNTFSSDVATAKWARMTVQNERKVESIKDRAFLHGWSLGCLCTTAVAVFAYFTFH